MARGARRWRLWPDPGIARLRRVAPGWSLPVSLLGGRPERRLARCVIPLLALAVRLGCGVGSVLLGAGVALAAPRCGDGIVQPSLGEVCDDGPLNSATAPDACRLDCKPHRHGDHVKDSDEECDDGNRIAGDGCDANGLIEMCGDGRLEGDETCDRLPNPDVGMTLRAPLTMPDQTRKRTAPPATT